MTAGNVISIVGIGVALLIAIIGGLYKLHIKALKDIAQDAKWKGKIEGERTELKTLLGEVHGDIKKILSWLLRSPLLGEGSPITLTEFGKRVSKDLRARKWAKMHASGLREELAGQAAYEVQEHCFAYIERYDNFTEEERRKIQGAAYDNGLDEDQIMAVFAIELRDELLRPIL